MVAMHTLHDMTRCCVLRGAQDVTSTVSYPDITNYVKVVQGLGCTHYCCMPPNEKSTRIPACMNALPLLLPNRKGDDYRSLNVKSRLGINRIRQSLLLHDRNNQQMFQCSRPSAQRMSQNGSGNGMKITAY